MVTAFGAWFLVLIAAFTALPARHAGVASQANPDDVLVIKAIIVDYISKEVVRFAKPGDPMSLELALATETLAVCQPDATPVIPCMVNNEDTQRILRRGATEGRWSPRYAELLAARNPKPTELSPIVLPGVVMGPRLELMKTHPRARSMSTSLPAYVGNQALVYAHFAQIYTYLFVLTKGPDGWHVTDHEIVSAS